MKIELVKQIFGEDPSYKIKKADWCCNKLKNNPIINVYNEYDEESFDDDSDDEIIPSLMIENIDTIFDYGDTRKYYKINFCPFCGEHIEVTVVKEEDVTEEFNKLEKEREKIWKRCIHTDSKKEESKLKEQVSDLDEKINWFYTLTSYKGESNG